VSRSNRRPTEVTVQLTDPPAPLREPAPLSAVLKVMSGNSAGQIVRLETAPIQLGRGPENDLVIDDSGVSRVHCRFLFHEGKAYLEDLGSTNGTYVNGERVTRLCLDAGAQILVGTAVRLRFFYLDSEENELEQRLYEGATKDALTGVLNRGSWLGQARSLWARDSRRSEWVSVAVLDLDRFKQINDTFGHPAGDAVLLEFSNRMNALGKDVIIGRIGGEEFAMLLPNSPPHRALRKLERLRETVAGAGFSISPSRTIPVTVSIGIASMVMEAGETLEELIARADEALYIAKRNGRNRVHFREPRNAGSDSETQRLLLKQKRRLNRSNCRTPVWIVAGGQRFEGAVLDVGVGGLRLFAEQGPELNETLEIRSQTDPSTFVRAVVRWRSAMAGRFRLGVKFLDGRDHLRTSWVGALLRALGSTAQNAVERRAQVRLQVSCAIGLASKTGISTARLLNLGEGGLMIEAPLVPPRGDTVHVKIAQWSAPAVVVWSAAPRCGLRFGPLSETQRLGLEKLLTHAARHHARPDTPSS
jgi:two-component system, cell cycle response regulator